MGGSQFTPKELPAEFDDIIRRFEKAWQSENRPDIQSYLPAPLPGNTRLLFELVHVDLDLRLRTGESAIVEHYLARFPLLERDRDAVLELIVTEYALRRHWQGVAAPEEYLLRFPQYSEELQPRFGDVEDTSVGSGASPTVEGPVTTARLSFSGYEILRELGRGGMGVVYQARQLAPDRLVAIKTV